ncbi:hypothetical protein L226DRAFT_552096 [Lentinus tigrinus ALCF2SS1-7]|uniref:2'-phosphotransferase n=1 Tax=Lentinus tigrinus ALCF2SS1-6 TaxID=1328759 RepID=A0A5C2SJW4_9APHY|nr:hypothetical protein L227DRAFT_571727 [Lentinus tigrinus ALCF2SS1-6]RPD76356.1 hypothetical protein L226DRAFT_552096 [Lentinus tigrinus ALCF2SS1-7]
MATTDAAVAQERQQRRQEKKDRKQQLRQSGESSRGRGGGSVGRRGGGGGGGIGGGSAKLRGLPKDSHDVRISKTLSWILRHGSQSEGLAMRKDGYVRVNDLLALPKMRELNLEALQDIVKGDAKGRYSLVLEANPDGGEESWWIRANQGHSMKSVVLDLEPISSHSDIPTGIAVHGTNKAAWEVIKEQGLSKMSRNHIHLAQGVPGSGVISGMRKSSDILIYINVQEAIDAGLKFYLSANGVVLTEGDDRGYLKPEFFSRVETAKGSLLPGYDGPKGVPPKGPVSIEVSAAIATDSPEGPGEQISRSVGPSKKDEGVQASLQEIEKKMESTNV